SSPQSGMAARRWAISSNIACCILMSMSGHHVEGDEVAVVICDAVDVPDLAANDEGALAVQRLDEAAQRRDCGHAINRSTLAELLHISINLQLQLLRQHRAVLVDIIADRISESSLADPVQALHRPPEPGAHQLLSSRSAKPPAASF